MKDTLSVLTLQALSIAHRDQDASVRKLASQALREWHRRHSPSGLTQLTASRGGAEAGQRARIR